MSESNQEQAAPANKFDRNKAQSLLSICATCNNCKLMVWEESAELKYTKQAFKMNSDDPKSSKKVSVLVRCAWLKQAIEQPMKIVVCDGWREISSGSSNEY